ncbi:glycine receptor subunit alpha-3 isoform X2 [Lingula anatina]|uniref:Glycine receptor subunit alpha-3 isoform X2 n=1 Tax=Lingula anatina TaxID=7574 RepID=A0A1S3I5S0_LINAN|nr:glycine receptor subunit alpha-3 isoform X2 [Lingula anatina]|eukprot:XP_013392719.1 glycine receptor subunit alpha-3 isoform X2 [Lingula anatina]
MEMKRLLHFVHIAALLLLTMSPLEAAGGKKEKRKRRRENNVHHDPPAVNSTSWFLGKLLRNYDKLRPPMQDKSTRVELGIYINSFYSISEQTMDFSVNIYLRQNWTDPRLAFDPQEGGRDMIKLEDGYWDRLWVPDVFFRNEKKANYHDVTIPNRLMRLYSNGQIWYVTKISATLSCPMDLKKYPLDVQHCPMMLESFGYTMDVLYFVWMKNAVDMDDHVSLPQYKLQGHQLEDCSQNYTAGAFPCLKVTFNLKRDIGYYMIQVYVPTALIVILSWVAFWISIDSSPARVSLGLLTVLTMTTQSASARASLPRVSYIKALDVWMSVCLVFVFASLLEYAAVNVFSRREIPKPSKASSLMEKFKGPSDKSLRSLTEVENGVNGRKQPPQYIRDPFGREKARMVDKLSRKLFPTTFILFCLIYWPVYIFIDM